MGTAATGYTAGMTAPATLRHPLPTPPIAGHAPGGPRDIDVLLQWDREHVWHAFTQMQEYEPLLIERGEGCWLVDADGNRYLDGSASMWCNVHGHRHPRLDAALVAQAGKVAHTTNLGLSNPTTVELATLDHVGDVRQCGLVAGIIAALA